MLGPAHFVALINAGDAIQQALERAQHRVHECLFTIEDPRHEDTHGFRDGQDQHQEKCDLEPSVSGHQNFSGRSKAYSKYTIISRLMTSIMIDSKVIAASLHSVTEAHISDRQHKKGNRNRDPK